MVSGSHLQAGEMAILFTPAQGGVAEATLLTLKDPLFLADAEKTMLEVDPITGDAMECMMKDAYRHPNYWFNGPRNSPRDRRGESNCTWHRCRPPAATWHAEAETDSVRRKSFAHSDLGGHWRVGV
jgi:hypothetical protein